MLPRVAGRGDRRISLHLELKRQVMCACALCRRVDAATANRANLTREEVELIDVAAEMEQQLLQQYTQVSTCLCM
jgi:hypothetical protein